MWALVIFTFATSSVASATRTTLEFNSVLGERHLRTAWKGVIRRVHKTRSKSIVVVHENCTIIPQKGDSEGTVGGPYLNGCAQRARPGR